MKRIFTVVWGAYFYTFRTFLTLVFYPAFRYYLSNEKFYNKAHEARKLHAKIVFFFTGIKYEVVGQENVNPSRNYIICANHSSTLDTFLIFQVPGITSFMGTIDLMKVPVVRRFFRTLDIPVDRSNASASAQSFRKALKWIETGRNLTIFPEGGIVGSPYELSPFKDGAFQVAIRKEIPILPIAIVGAHERLPDDFFGATPGKVKLILHKPVETSGCKIDDLELVKGKVFNILNDTLTIHWNGNNR
jgi:1-acyl-sn-glycerol-3-phosphate acyltransferase